MNIFRLVTSIIYFIMGGTLISVSKFLPDKYYLKMRLGYRVLNSCKLIKLGRLLAFFSGTCWLVISYLFYNDMDIIKVFWINIALLGVHNIMSYRYIEKIK